LTHASIPKPNHLGREYAEQFADPAVVAAYHHRPPYSARVFTVLHDLVVGQPRTVLDLGCGTGDIARPLAEVVDSVDAVDCSAGMIERGQSLPGGASANLHWVLGYAEEVPLPRANYGLATAGESLHWMDWDRLFPRLSEVLAPGAYLALISRGQGPTQWWDDLLAVIQRYSTNRDYQPYSLLAELEKRGLFEQHGVERIDPLPFQQSFETYIESIHSRNGFSRDRMMHEAATAFDAEAQRLLAARCPAGYVQFDVVGQVVWGRPRVSGGE
jgi:ubiquinone/menaquinone biosynthesis C-methylase UbiE